MGFVGTRLLRLACLGIGISLLLSPANGGAQTIGASQSAKPEEQTQEKQRLAKQVEELRQAGRFQEAVPLAERLLELERRAGGETTAGVAEALSRLAELHELQGDWSRAVARCKEVLSIRERVDGKDHWRTADARLAITFAEKVAGLGAADRAKVEAALRKEHEANRLMLQGKNAEAERGALEVLEIYKVGIGPETAEVARVWHAVGRTRLG
jgi:hypothetical protein